MATLRVVTRIAPLCSSAVRSLTAVTTPTIPSQPHPPTTNYQGARLASSNDSSSRRGDASWERHPKRVDPFSTKDYGAGPSEEARKKGIRMQIIAGASTAALASFYLLYKQLNAKEGEESEEEGAGQEEKKKRVSFHDRRVIEYENRIRAYSTPDKIFRYFATIRLKDKGAEPQIYMTPEDFLRSITPGDIQPAEYGLDQFRTLNMESLERQKGKILRVYPDSVFASLGFHGLISFSDYLFLLTILATPTRHFEIAFKMFDLNGDGEVDCEEFQTVQGVILNSTAVGARHRDHSTTGSVAGSVGDGLVEKFFGKNKDHRLTVDQFKDFHMQLLEEVMKLEFDRYDQVNGKIAELDFARFILSYAAMNNQRKKKFFKRVRRKYGNNLKSTDAEQGRGISLEEMKSFAKVVEGIADVEMALSMHSAAGASITAGDLKLVARVVVGVTLSDNLLEFIITIFDEDGDGNLSHNEFIKIMKSRTTRGLEKSKELGISRFLGAVSACSVKTVKDQLGLKS